MLDLFELVLYGEVCETDSFRIGPVEMSVDGNQGDRVATALADSVDDGTPLPIEHSSDEGERTVKPGLDGRA